MMYSIFTIAKVLQGRFLNSSIVKASIQHLLLDSRQVIFPNTSLFFGLIGNRHNGHDFVKDLYHSGVRNFVISEQLKIDYYKNANFILVPNTTQALQQLATFHRHNQHLQVIGITGSNGKTVTKEWLFQLLQGDFQVVRSPKSYNSQVGVPLSVWQIQPQHTLGIFEAGISQMNEMAQLSKIIDCDIGIFTNIGTAHSEGFSKIETKIKEKVKLFENASCIIFCQDEERIAKEIRALPNKDFFTWSKISTTKSTADLNISSFNQSPYSTEINARYLDQKITITIPFIDDASIENAIHCWATLLFLGYNNTLIQKRVQKLEPVAMRLELKEGVNNCVLINDSYNSDLSSLTIALNFLKQQGKTTRHTLVISDILQSGLELEDLYKKVARLLGEKKIARVIGIGKAICFLKKYLPSSIEIQFYDNTDDFLKTLSITCFQNETILLKGARKFEFERIANRLSKKVHQTTLEINLTALMHNHSVFHSYLRPHTKMMVMVKASAYGSGSIEVAKLLEFQNVDYLGVAYADEGVELRKAGIQTPIFVMNPEEATFQSLLRHQLEPEIYSLKLLRAFHQFVQLEKAKANIHLKLETGMNRLGFEREDLKEVVTILKNNPYLNVASIFSHLAASDISQQDNFTHQQVNYFGVLYEILVNDLGYRPIRHILNSSGITRFPAYQMEMVRLGIGLYGIGASSPIKEKLRVVNTLKATISQIKNLKKGDTVGYGRAGIAKRDQRIATISIGYADGLLRGAGRGAFQVLLHHQFAPIIGNVCMDMTMIDVTDIAAAKEGDEVIIFGQKPSVENLATCLNTIPYEIFTNISSRVKRVYFQE